MTPGFQAMIAERPGFTPTKNVDELVALGTAAGGSLFLITYSVPARGMTDKMTFIPDVENEERGCSAYEQYLNERWGAPQTMTLPKGDVFPDSTLRIWLDPQTHHRATMRLSPEQHLRCWLEVDEYLPVNDALNRIGIPLLGKPMGEVWRMLEIEPQDEAGGYLSDQLGIGWGFNMSTVRYMSRGRNLGWIRVHATVAKKTYELLLDELAHVPLVHPTVSYNEVTGELALEVSAPESE